MVADKKTNQLHDFMIKVLSNQADNMNMLFSWNQNKDFDRLLYFENKTWINRFELPTALTFFQVYLCFHDFASKQFLEVRWMLALVLGNI